MKKLRYLKIGRDGLKNGAGLIVEGIPHNLFVCEDGNSHQESFEILLSVLGCVFSKEKVKAPKVYKNHFDDGSYEIIKVTTGYLGKQKCILFQIRDNVLLVKRSHFSANMVKNWIEQIRYYS